ncbi:hypothetical protein ASD04_00125 [Devosia sp. Root436]|uniref:hypothetical protein n=1 Tax=Devosia sp. Root436 TaxID=1736537 RepID=UPI00070097FA|nr:hypothetical protein [Devosia sp. Root436]KQX42416.1 hypothetical protein ASD04_00125 [Devosia sp. Root436]
MPDTPIATSEAELWAALQLDLEPLGTEPETYAPVDAAFVRSLIVAAEDRVSRFCGVAPIDMDAVPPNLAAAIQIDVSTHYFARLNPVLPDAWAEMIAPHRKWGFGGAVAEESAT